MHILRIHLYMYSDISQKRRSYIGQDSRFSRLNAKSRYDASYSKKRGQSCIKFIR